MRFMVLSRVHQLYVGVVLLLVLPIVAAIGFQSQLYGFYLHQFVRPGLEQEFGFTGGVVPLPTEGKTYHVYTITGVVPGGRLEVAGCRAGDIPVGHEPGFETGFLQDLLGVRRGRAADFQVLAVADVGKVPRAWRTIRLAPRH
jgi:hypothetical protein